MLQIRIAGKDELPQLVPLFDQYRVFYKQDSDPVRGETFLAARMEKGESVIFMAFHDGHPAGFTQLYTSFSSVSMEPIFILNDLFVAPGFRKMGIGEHLLRKAQAHCRAMKFKGLALETAYDNPAQYLYERLGWNKDSHCFHYFWSAT